MIKPYLYILKNKIPVPVADVLDWGRWFEKANRKVAMTFISDSVYVSTVFLGIDHNFGYFANKPLLFETMIFGGHCDGYQRRYATWAGAEYGHKRAVAMAENMDTIFKDLTNNAMREIQVNMVLNVPDEITEDMVSDLFVEWVESRGWQCEGGVKDITDENKNEKLKTDNELMDAFIGEKATQLRQMADESLQEYPGRTAMGCILFQLHHHGDNCTEDEIVYKEKDVIRLLEFLGYPVKFGDE